MSAQLSNVNRRYSVPAPAHARPESVEAVQELVRSTSGPIKVSGGRYSVGSVPLPAEGGLLLDLSALCTVSAPDRDLVTVGAGTTMRQLLDALQPAGCLPGVVPLLGNFSIGAISGTPLYDIPVITQAHAHFSADVVGYRLVDAAGQLRSVHVDTDPELVFFLRTHQGLLGIVVEITLRVYPIAMHQVHFQRLSLDEHLADPGEHPHTYRYVYPYQGTLIAERHVRQPAALMSRSDWLMRQYQRLAGSLDGFAQRVLPQRWTSRFQYLLQYAFVLKTRWLGPGRLSPLDRGQLAPRHRSISLTDWQVPRERYLEALQGLVALCREHQRDSGLTVAFISVYFVPQSAAGAGYSSRHADQYAIDLVSYHPHHPALPALESAWAELARSLGGRVSVNKNSDHTMRAADLQHVFGETDYRRFQELCAQADPRGRFRNPLLCRLFDLPAAPGEL